MSKFPSKITMIISLFVLAVFASVKYSSKTNYNFLQTKFDWENKIELKELSNLKVDSLSYNRLILSGVEPGYKPNNRNTFILLADKDRYSFRFIGYKKNGDTLNLGSVEWLTGVPELPNIKVKLIEADVPLKEKKGPTIITIGNGMLIKNEAKYFRRKTAYDIDVNFEGRIKDVFNYKNEATYADDWSIKFDEVHSIPDAEIYILMGGFDIEKLGNPLFKDNLQTFLHNLKNRKTTQRVIWVLCPYVKNEGQNQENQKWNQFIKTLKTEKIEFLDAYQLFKTEKKEYLLPDSIQLNRYGYELLANKTVELLK